MGLFRKSDDEFEARIRDARPEPPADIVSEIARRLQPAPARRSSGLRLGLAAGLTMALLVAFASVGGVGYASAAASKARAAVSHATGSNSNNRVSTVRVVAASTANGALTNGALTNRTNGNGTNGTIVTNPHHPSPHHPSHHQYGHEREPICHNGHTLVLPRPAVDAHDANHPRDTRGPCP